MELICSKFILNKINFGKDLSMVDDQSMETLESDPLEAASAGGIPSIKEISVQ